MQISKLNTGRSMIEILGVLATVALLTMAGLWGYRKLLDNHQVNTILSDVSIYHMTLDTKEEKFDENGDALDTDFRPESPVYEYDAHDTDEDYWFITVSKVPGRICQLLLSKAKNEGTNYLVGEYVMGFTDDEKQFKLYKGDQTECEEQENTMVFLVGKNICDGACPIDNLTGEETFCHYGACCTEERTCGQNCCAEGQDCCNGQCIAKVECPDNQRYDKNACGCVCAQDYSGMQLVSDGNGGCTCPKDSNNVQLVLNNGSCSCPTAGYTLTNGKCSKIDCRNGTTGNTFQCFVDNKSCGWNCDSTGHGCSLGYCYAEDCKSDEEFVQKNVTGNGGYNYSCKKHVKDGFDCYYPKFSNVGYYCYKDGQYCCNTTDTTNFECMTGLCGNEERCKDVKSDSTIVGDTCDFSAGLKCQYSNGTWECLKYGYYCADCTEEQIRNGSCCSGTSCKVSSTTTGVYNPNTKKCEYQVGNETVSCTATDPISGSVQNCYIGDTLKCQIYIGRGYTNPGLVNNSAGLCPEFADTCPEGTKYDLVNGYYDCKNQTPNAPVCLHNGNNTGDGKGTDSIACYYNGQKCGEFCDYFGGGCKKVYLPQCAPAGHCTQNGYDMTNNPCTCDGAVSSGLVTVKDANGNETQTYHDFCCPAGHTYTNGACAM